MSSDGPRVLVAPDKFKASATARAVADALAEGIEASRRDADVVRLPVADGGDGTVDALLAAGFEAIVVRGLDAYGEPVTAVAARRGPLVVIELASLCGLARASADGRRADPLAASSAGLGVAMRALLRAGARDVVLALGGSASTDGGLGLLLALGARGFDADGRPVTADGRGLLRVSRLDISAMRLPAGLRVRVACDVESPLHGRTGAAHAFGAQKGAGPELRATLDSALQRWGGVLAQTFGHDPSERPGAGAAGGVGAAALAGLAAERVAGADLVLAETGFDRHLGEADLVVTGEGSWDAQSAWGKGPGVVVARARDARVPVALVAGRVDPASIAGYDFASVHSLVDLAGAEDVAMARTVPLLRSVGRLLGRQLTGHRFASGVAWRPR